MIYLDNASTSFPKPPEVHKAIANYLENYAVSPGRGSYALANRAEDVLHETRQLLASLLGVRNSSHVVLCHNATHALNIVIKGALKQGDHALACSYSHNSALRPLEHLARNNIITYDVFNIDANGMIDAVHLARMIKPNTKMLVLNCASNVLGVLAPIHLIADICTQHKILLLLDVTQAIVYESINISELNVDFVAGTGHKSLLGPTGCGFLYVRDAEILEPLIEGGSGGISSISPIHPKMLPHKFEAGTHNMLSIAGLHAGLEYIMQRGCNNIRNHALELTKSLWQKLAEIPEITLYGTADFNRKVPVVSFTVKSMLTNELAYIYDQQYNICIRAGIQCAPLVHKSLGTAPAGTIRVSPGLFNTIEDIDKFVAATQQTIYEVNHGKVSAG